MKIFWRAHGELFGVQSFFYRLRNIFNFILPHKRHLTAGLLYNDFGVGWELAGSWLEVGWESAGSLLEVSWESAGRQLGFHEIWTSKVKTRAHSILNV